MAQHKFTTKQYWKDLLIMFLVFFKLGAFCFGGGYAMLALIESEIVEKRNWLTHDELSDIFAIAESTPGPIAINTATFIGTRKCGVFGGIVATLGVVIPPFAVIIGLSYALDAVKDNKWVQCLFSGIRVGVLILIANAVLKFYKDMRKDIPSFIFLIASFSIVFFTNVSVIYVILGTIIISTLLVAFRHFYHKKFYHQVGTPAYYNERIGRPIENDEYVRLKCGEQDTRLKESSALLDSVDEEINSIDHANEEDKHLDIVDNVYDNMSHAHNSLDVDDLSDKDNSCLDSKKEGKQ